MKTTFTLITLLLTSLSFGQLRQVDQKKAIRTDKVVRMDAEPVTIKPLNLILGDFEVEKYYILSRNTPALEDIKLLIGSLVRIQDSSITGANIEPLTYVLGDVTSMSRDEYIYNTFGRQVRRPEPDIPDTLNVHKTDNENCYGIIEIDRSTMGIPYKGLLLVLKRR